MEEQKDEESVEVTFEEEEEEEIKVLDLFTEQNGFQSAEDSDFLPPPSASASSSEDEEEEIAPTEEEELPLESDWKIKYEDANLRFRQKYGVGIDSITFPTTTEPAPKNSSCGFWLKTGLVLVFVGIQFNTIAEFLST